MFDEILSHFCVRPKKKYEERIRNDVDLTK